MKVRFYKHDDPDRPKWSWTKELVVATLRDPYEEIDLTVYIWGIAGFILGAVLL